MKLKVVMPIMAVITAICMCTAAVSIIWNCTKETKFIPPEHDKTAVSWSIKDTESFDLAPIDANGIFLAYISGRVVCKDGKAFVGFVSDRSNTALLKLRILDEDGNIIAQTGLINPGEYIEYVLVDEMPDFEKTIKMKIMSYEPETYFSLGSVSLNTVMQMEDILS